MKTQQLTLKMNFRRGTTYTMVKNQWDRLNSNGLIFHSYDTATIIAEVDRRNTLAENRLGR